MRTTKTIDVDICDLCNVRTAYHKCFRCGMDLCSDCPRAEFKTGVYGSYSFNYCVPCDIALCESKDDELHTAGMKVRALKQESEEFYASWEKRKAIVEAEADAAYVKVRPRRTGR